MLENYNVYAIIRKALLAVALAFSVILCTGRCFGADFDRIAIARLKYSGGGDWYVSPTSIPNLLKQADKRFKLPTQPEHIGIAINDPEIFRYPMLYASGHGQIRFKDNEIMSILTYLDNGGFLWINDSYGMEKYVRREVRRLYPDREFVQLPKDHPIFHTVYDFKDGLPKIHEHDGKPPAAYAIFDKGRMKILYLLESDVGDGLEDEGIHKVDTPEIREMAMKMGLNILVYAMMQ